MVRTEWGDPLIVALIPNAFILEIRDVNTPRALPIGTIFNKGIQIITIRIGLRKKLPLNETASCEFVRR
jgi:hypothetical protein